MVAFIRIDSVVPYGRLSYLANSRYVAYLDDDNWYAPEHLRTLRSAIEGNAWAFSHRWFAHPNGQTGIVIDEWESIGVNRKANKDTYAGFVDTSCFMLEKSACHMIFPFWSQAMTSSGDGEDRVVLNALLDTKKPGVGSGIASVHYTLDPNDLNHAFRLAMMREKGINLDTLVFSNPQRLLARESNFNG